MTKILNFGLKIKGVVGRVAHAKSPDPATPPPKKKLKSALNQSFPHENEAVNNDLIEFRV